MNLSDPGEPSLTGIHLIFQHAMQGDLAAQTLEFFRGVRVGVRPVDSWDRAGRRNRDGFDFAGRVDLGLRSIAVCRRSRLG